MNISKESTGEQTAVIHINLLESDYIDAVNKQLKEYRKKANMPGFRPGKVPMGMIKKMYGTATMVEEINKIISESLSNYILDNKINVIGQPIPNEEKSGNVDFINKKDFDFFFDIGLAPELEVKLSEDIKVPYYNIAVSDKEIDNAIEDIKVRFGEDEHPEVSEIDDALQGEFVQLDEEGNPIENGVKNEGFLKYEDIKLKTIQKKFVGKKIGDTVVFNPMNAIKVESKVKSLLNITTDGDENLTSDYRFDISKVVRTHIAELNEELYAKVFPGKEIKTEEELRTALSEDLAKHYERDTDRQFLGDTIKELMKLTNPTLPDEFVKRWLLESNQGKITQEQVDEEYDGYARSFKWQMLESELLKDHKSEMEVTEEEVRGKVAAYFQTMGGAAEMTPQIEGIIDQVLSNADEKRKIFQDIQDEKLIALFKEHVSLENKKITTEEFVEIAQKID